MPLVSLTRATLRNAEFGFLGVCVYTRVQTPRFCGQDCRAGLAVLYFGAVRPLRTSWLNVGTLCSSFVLHASSKLAHGLTPQQNSWRQPWPHLCACALSIALDAHRGTRFIPTIGTGQPLRGLSDRSAMLPLTQHPGEYRFPIRLGVRRWRRGRSASQPESRCGDRERGHSVSLPRPAYPLESSSGSADTFQRGHPANTILQDRDQCSTATHYRQAKYDPQNPFNIASRERSVNQTGTKFRSVATLARRVPNHNSIRLAGFERPACTRSMPRAAKRRKLSLAETVRSLYTEGFPTGIIFAFMDSTGIWVRRGGYMRQFSVVRVLAALLTAICFFLFGRF